MIRSFLYPHLSFISLQPWFFWFSWGRVAGRWSRGLAWVSRAWHRWRCLQGRSWWGRVWTGISYRSNYWWWGSHGWTLPARCLRSRLSLSAWGTRRDCRDHCPNRRCLSRSQWSFCRSCYQSGILKGRLKENFVSVEWDNRKFNPIAVHKSGRIVRRWEYWWV